MGIGQALLEDTTADRVAVRILNPGLNEYLIPAHAGVPQIDVALVEEREEQINILGVKGIGELSIYGVAPAITSAVHHATGRRIRDLPTPQRYSSSHAWLHRTESEPRHPDRNEPRRWVRTGSGPPASPSCQRAGIGFIQACRAGWLTATWAGRAASMTAPGGPPPAGVVRTAVRPVGSI
jgi:hypothetical protein